jgi:hypothetical protein
MNLPDDTSLPFFAYGIFKPGQISYILIKEYVQPKSESCTVNKQMWIRDGIPILDKDSKTGKTAGYVIEFIKGLENEAYGKIVELEPQKYYFWSTIEISGRKVNYLSGKSPHKGSAKSENPYWDSWRDPLFSITFEVIKYHLERLKSDLKDPEGRACLELQMLYLLLWTSIERFASLRFGFRAERIIGKLHKLCLTPEFKQAQMQSLKEYPPSSDRLKIYSTDTIDKHYYLDSADSKEFIEAHYQVRCNIAHRGKGVISDTELIYHCLLRMKTLFENLLNEARKKSEMDLLH